MRILLARKDSSEVMVIEGYTAPTPSSFPKEARMFIRVVDDPKLFNSFMRWFKGQGFKIKIQERRETTL